MPFQCRLQVQWNQHFTEQPGPKFFYVAVGMWFVPVLEVWILGTVKVSCLRQIYFMSRFRVRRVSLCRNSVCCSWTKLGAGVLIYLRFRGIKQFDISLTYCDKVICWRSKERNSTIMLDFLWSRSVVFSLFSAATPLKNDVHIQGHTFVEIPKFKWNKNENKRKLSIIIIIIKLFIHAVYWLIMINMNGTCTWSEFYHWETWYLYNAHALWLIRFLRHIVLSRHLVWKSLL